MTPRSTWRDLRAALRHMGARAVRARGSHETWRFDDGETFVAVINHLNDDVPRGIMVKFRRLRLRRAGRANREPALLGRTGPRWSRPLRGERIVMSKGSNGGGKGTGGSKGSSGSGGSKGGQGQVPNLPSTTGNPSGGGRGNAPPSK